MLKINKFLNIFSFQVLRLMENHTTEMDHLSSKILDLEEKLQLCGNESLIERDRVSLLLDSQKKCRKTLVKVSRTLDGLTRAFQVQYKRSNLAESKLQENLAHFSDLQTSLVLKDGMTIKLQDNNDQLRQKVKSLESRCLKITEKVSFNIESEASYVYILSGRKMIKNAENGPFCRIFENLKLAVKQSYQTGQF